MGFSDVFDPGRKDRKRARKAGELAQLQYGNFAGPMGITSGYDVSKGKINLTGGLGGLDPIMQSLFAMSMGGLNGGLTGGLGVLPQFLTAGAQNTQAQLGPEMLAERARLGNLFQGAMDIAGQSPWDLGASVVEKLQPGLERAQQKMTVLAKDKLFSRGGNAVSSVRDPALENLSNTFAEQNAALDIQGLNVGRGLQQDALSRAFGALGQSMGIGGFNREGALNSFGIDQQLFNSMLGLGGQQFGQAMQGLSAGTSMLTLPLAFQNALQGLAGLNADTQLGIAGMHQQNAQMAKSPFLEALNAAGSFANNIGFSLVP